MIHLDPSVVPVVAESAKDPNIGNELLIFCA